MLSGEKPPAVVPSESNSAPVCPRIVKGLRPTAHSARIDREDTDGGGHFNDLTLAGTLAGVQMGLTLAGVSVLPGLEAALRRLQA